MKTTPKVIEDTFKASPENEKKHKADAKKRAADLKKPAPAFVPRKAADGSYKPGKDMRATIDDAIRATVRAKFGKVVPVLGTLGVRYHAPYKLGQPYIRQLLDNGHTVFVSLASGTVTVSEKPASKSSFTVREFNKRQAAKTTRAAAKLAHEEKASKAVSK
jgi:hypothetical protein